MWWDNTPTPEGEAMPQVGSGRSAHGQESPESGQRLANTLPTPGQAGTPLGIMMLWMVRGTSEIGRVGDVAESPRLKLVTPSSAGYQEAVPRHKWIWEPRSQDM